MRLKHQILFLILILLLVGLAACTRPARENQSSTTPTLAENIYPDLPPQRSLEHGGFEFVSPSGYTLAFFPGIVFINDPDSYFFISLGGGYETETVHQEDIIGQTLDSLTDDMDELNTAEPIEVTIAGQQGLAVSFQGIQDDQPVEGQLLYVLLNNQQSFTMLGFGAQEVWINQGQALFTQVLDGLAFFEATPLTQGCPVTRDPEYGYSPVNPIRVASVVADQAGPLAGFYFDFLRGPDNQSIRFSLATTQPVENSLLDVYQVSYEGAAQPVKLYVDEYHSGQLMVPIGFSCQY